MPAAPPHRPASRSRGAPTTKDRRLRLHWRGPVMLLLPASLALTLALSQWPDSVQGWVERHYSTGVYPYVSSLLSLLCDWSPISVGETLLVGLALWVFGRSFLALAEVIRGARGIGNALLHGVVGGLTLAGALAGSWLVLWGLNYHRRPLAETLGLDVRPSSKVELVALCEELVALSGALREEVSLGPGGLMTLSGGREDCLARVATGFQVASRTYPVLEWNYARPKLAVLSPVLSRLNVTGIYSPLTGEPHVNGQITDAELPFTASHELAHQVGFAREKEANFVAFLACRAHPDPDFRYSGATEALVYALGALRRADPAAYGEVWKKVPDGVRADFVASAENWQRYDSPAREVATAVNDTYLKVQGEQGVESYGLVVDLMLAERRR